MGIDQLVPWAQPAARWALDAAEFYGVPVTVTSVRRSRAKQAALYRRYLAGESRWPAAPPGNSAHEFGLAWDSWVPDEFMPWWASVRRYAGWQVPDSDIIHAVVPDWRRYVDAS